MFAWLRSQEGSLETGRGKGLSAVKVAVITVSDRASSGEYEDISGPTAEAALVAEGAEVIQTIVVDDERSSIVEALEQMIDAGAQLIITTGGTGVAKRDVTPEATHDVIDRLVPGIGERLRAEALAKTPFASLSRGVAGIKGNTLIVNLPGSPGGVRDGLQVVAQIGSHAIKLLSGTSSDHDYLSD